ncbi:DUF2147 domain-containing protein [Aquiflexum gelatinilyticum]|uniref:DUF2147 domain-containing protein n=1 Tax=Aquiflexum gelatinilyticum TaxID=2961943 RepID=A0A9X2P2E3_9BACT|nr:DUF2147 domain-containing protein [Aquiflexum gelatinilyticum]MCR9013597.1 DUF2147 domain-containing protein [Aquiflexum gelatinilyticum]
MEKVNKVIITIFLVIAAFQAHAQESINGIWLTEEGNSKVEIYQKGDKSFGKVVWLEQPTDQNGNPVTDRNNPNKDLRNRQVLGIDMLKDLQYRNGKWYGKIYAPKRGLELDVVLVGLGKEKLELNVSYRGFTRKQTWTRSTL